MNDNKLSKGRLIGYIALWFLVAFFSYAAIFEFIRCSGFLSFDFGNSFSSNYDKELYPWIIILLILSMIVWLAGISSLVYHCARLIKGNGERLLLHTLVETIAIACSAVGVGELVFAMGNGFDAAPGREFFYTCFNLFFIAAVISLGTLYLNIFREKKMGKRLKICIYIGITFVVICILILFIPNAVVTFLSGC